ncbi:aldehyde dehydrogenase [Clostridium fallax]|uniref:Aldehyde dehydrogenase n=1 Tax=Clostridium fallax TaxID=1533 RepID=A0A1M4TY14_9CLOT|nr:aldehyde dehydrogenase [Clostridium fallax]SHE49207.1 aldehyde dehydrogenase (NAD+) [Clostridium fallax]SQB22342.1 aldehyde dehydrogenase [Clostridium fallax]
MIDLDNILKIQKDFYNLGITKNLDWRIERLKVLKEIIKKYEEEILNALKEDLHKSSFEGYATEVGIVYEEINTAIKHLKKWAKPEKKRTSISYFPAKSLILKEPYGVVLIIGPFNYPFQLCMAPLVGAIAAGNCVVLKSSEHSQSTGKIIDKIIKEAFSEEHVSAVDYRGGKESVQKLINQPFNYIFFTGSVKVGKIIMSAAAKNLIPVTLELGGKSPCIVDYDSKVQLAAKRIVWGKFLNAGQTCVAPDYIYVQKNIKDKFLVALKEEINKQFGDNIKNSEDYPRIINEDAFNRLINLIQKDKVYFGGDYSKNDLYIEPTILNNITWEDPIMEDEIFGPIIPVIEFEDLNEVINEVNNRPSPLALYYFSESVKKINRILSSISSGGATINDTVVHVASTEIPFGGVGNSGMGNYHGKYSFDTFTHKKGIMKRGTWLDINIRYAPFKDKLSIVKRIMK